MLERHHENSGLGRGGGGLHKFGYFFEHIHYVQGDTDSNLNSLTTTLEIHSDSSCQ